jgi:AbrB family looped-hinge helix DNA binding protein
LTDAEPVRKGPGPICRSCSGRDQERFFEAPANIVLMEPIHASLSSDRSTSRIRWMFRPSYRAMRPRRGPDGPEDLCPVRGGSLGPDRGGGRPGPADSLDVRDALNAEIVAMLISSVSGKAVKLTTAKLSSKNQLTIPKRVLRELGLESGDELILEVREGEIALRVPKKVDRPTSELYGSVIRKGDAVRAVREIRSEGGRT